jgi:AcrR family transcriptional regulator
MINGVAAAPNVTAHRGRAWRASQPRSQRQRLLAAITHLAITDGYGDATVARVTAAAGVSRATFYECFDDREACFAAALAPIADELLGCIGDAVSYERPQYALAAAVRALVAHACSHPAQARLLIGDTLGGGSRLRAARDRLLDEAALVVEQAQARAPAGSAVSGLPPRLVLGATCRTLAPRLRAPRCSNELAEGLVAWVAAYELPAASECWHSLAALAPAARSPFLPPVALSAPRDRGDGRPRTASGALAEDNWLRIVFATAEVVRRDGAAAATVAQITEAAGIDSRVFYRLFDSKQRALAAAGELLFRHAIAAAAAAFAPAGAWPDRVWEAARALIQYAQDSPALTYVSLVECHSGESLDGRDVQDFARAFTVFLQEGLRELKLGHGRSTDAPSELVLEAISMGAFELCYRHVRECDATPLASLLGQLVFISLAPFIGARQAIDFICSRTADLGEPAGTASAV